MNTELMPYRLKTARRKKRLQKEDYDKQLLKAERRLEEIKDSKEEIFEKLDEPYQKGWKRLFVLKKEVAQSDKAALYQGILDKINEVQYHFDERFKKRGRGNRWYRGDYKEQPKLSIINMYYRSTYRFGLTDEQLKYFKVVNYWNNQYYRWEPHYVFAEPWLFEIKVLPHIIYEVKLGDALLAQEESFLDSYLYNGKTAARLAKIKGRRYNRWNVDYDKKSINADPFKNRQVWDVLNEC